MPEYACEAPFDWGWPQPIPNQYDANSFMCSSYTTAAGTVSRYRCCGFLAETAETEETEERPVSFYLAVVALVYCAVLTVVFIVWASKHRPNTAVSRRVASQVRYAPQVVVQQPQPQVVIQPTA